MGMGKQDGTARIKSKAQQPAGNYSNNNANNAVQPMSQEATILLCSESLYCRCRSMAAWSYHRRTLLAAAVVSGKTAIIATTLDTISNLNTNVTNTVTKLMTPPSRRRNSTQIGLRMHPLVSDTVRSFATCFVPLTLFSTAVCMPT